jgi:pyruvate kinase
MGPACDDKKLLIDMINAGMNVARFNMSHGTREEQIARFNLVNEAIAESGKIVALLLDTKGPEIRIGVFENGAVELAEGQRFSLYRDARPGSEEGVGLSFPKLIDNFIELGEERTHGQDILFDDGKLQMKVERVEDDAIVCVVIKGGRLSNRKSINIPNFEISMPYISKFDREDIELGLSHGVQFIAASFVRSEYDVMTLRDYVDSLGYKDVEIISKIENQSGVDNIDRIIQASDGVMVARGDMGVEIPFVKLPAIQKDIICRCIAQRKYVITATQMLESMTCSPRPTRAEISDVANAVYDGTSAVMLSGESAVGQYPLESVRTLVAICEEAESNARLTMQRCAPSTGSKRCVIPRNICMAAKEAAQQVGAKAIIVESKTGRAARVLTHYRPNCPIIVVVYSETVCKKLSLNWGITAVVGKELHSSDEITRQAIEKAVETGIVSRGDRVIVISSNKVMTHNDGTDTLNIRVV